MEDRAEPTYEQKVGLLVSDLTILVIFFIEIVLRVVFVAKLKYFLDVWNAADCAIITSSIILIGAALVNGYSSGTTDFTLRVEMRYLRFFILFNRLQRFRTIYLDFHNHVQSKKYGSNLERTLMVLKNLRSKKDLSSRTRHELEWLATVIKRNQLYEPVLQQSVRSPSGVAGDQEASTWLIENYTSSMPRTSSTIDTYPAEKLLRHRTSAELLVEEGSHDFLAKLMHVTNLTTEAISNLLVDLNEWSFNIFKIDEATDGRPIIFIAYAVFKNYALYESFKLEENVVRRFFTAVEAGYRRELPYHNNIHAADVMQSVYVFLLQDEFRKNLQAHDVLAILIAAAIHDYDHPGVNNAFLINTKSDVALLYNDKSVLENHHIAGGFHLMTQQDRDILQSLPKDLALEIRESIIVMVLATDIKFHFEELGKFTAYMNEARDSSGKENFFSN